MKNHSPIYNLLHQEIKTCADHLLEISQKQGFSAEEDGDRILGKLNELHQFSMKMCSEEHYHPLSELKNYLESTMLGYQDDQKLHLTMRLSEAISLLGVPPEPGIKFKSTIVNSLMHHLVRHFLKEVKPGRPLFRQLNEIKQL
jgi:hypothetical protein